MTTKTIISVIFFILIITGISTYLSIGISIYLDLGDFNRQLEQYYYPDSENFAYTGDRAFQGFFNNEVDWDFFRQRATMYEYWTDEFCIAKEEWDCSTTHISLNFKNGITSPFKDYSQYLSELNDFVANPNSIYREISHEIPFGDYGDSPCWTGVYLSSLAFHYAVACREGDATEANDVLEKIIRPVNGLHISTHVTGLDGNLVRFAMKDTPENRERMLDYFYKKDNKGKYTIEREFGPDENRWQGQGEYSDWVYVDDTSRDQHFGMFLGYGVVYKLLSDITPPAGINAALKDQILLQIGEDGTDVLDCLMGSNWHVIEGEKYINQGRGHNGASMIPRIPWASGGDFMLAALAFGKMVDSTKYAQYYDTVMNRFLTTSFQDCSNQAQSYFGNNLAFMNLFLAWFLVDDVHKPYVTQHYNNDYYAHLKYHRNVMVNLGYLIVNGLDLSNDLLKNEKFLYLLDDVTENLDTFARWKYPVRVWHIPKPEDYENIISQKNEMYYNIFQDDSSHILNSLYGFIIGELSIMRRSKFALGVKTMPPSNFVWQRSPFHVEGHMPDNPDYKGNKQMGGADFTLPYWMGLYFGYFS